MLQRPETIASLKRQAIAKTGFSDFGDGWYEQPLSAWVLDLAGPLLSESGRTFLARLAVTNLCRRLEIIDCLKRHPEIDDVDIPPILYVTGLERSGTTLLHNLLAQHPKSRALLRWELMRPTPPPEATTYRSDSRIAEVQASIDPLRGTQLEAMHWVNADEPEECTWGAYDCTGLLGRAAVGVMPNWRSWLRQNDLSPSFREQRRLIKLLTWRNPVAAGGHLVLKCPQNSRNIVQLSGMFPEARFIFTHRDPYRAAVSVCALADHITARFSQRCDMYRPGSTSVIEVVESAETALVQMTTLAAAFSDDVAHVAYPALVRDPVSVVREVYDRFRIDPPADLDQRVASFLAAQASGKRATPPSVLPDYGLTYASLMKRTIIAGYCKRFDVAPETTRLTGT
jgi:hypothetical protein